MTRGDFEEAERLGKLRARQWPMFAVLFLCQQASFFAVDNERHVRTVDWVKSVSWLVLTGVILAALWTGGYWIKRREVRALMNDEVTRAHRADALALGFLLAMMATIALYCISFFEDVPARLALHTITSAGLVTGLIRFGMLERRAHRG
jgi:hypothetical protein